MVPAISTKDYAVGDLICSGMPFLNVLNNDVKSEYCDNCLCQSKTVTLENCSACKHVFYCSKTCQKEDWFAGHKYECKYYKHHYSDLKDDVPRALLRLHLLLKNKKVLAPLKGDLQYDESMEKSFDDLEKGPATSIFELTFSHILKIFKDCGIGNVDRSTLFEYFRKLSNNYLPVFFKYHCVAYGIYSSPSVFSNSCAPNATRSFNRYRSDVRAIKEIKKGDPITISISRVDISREERRSYLESLLIDCKCERCTSNFDREFDYAYKMRLEVEMNMVQQWDKAFQVGKKLTPLYKHLGGYDITVSWHLMRMAEIYRKMPNVALEGNDGGIGDILKDTVKHVKVTHGVDHPLYKEYLQLLEEYQKAKGETKKSPGQGAVPRVSPLEVEQIDETAILKLFYKLYLQFK